MLLHVVERCFQTVCSFPALNQNQWLGQRQFSNSTVHLVVESICENGVYSHLANTFESRFMSLRTYAIYYVSVHCLARSLKLPLPALQ